MYQNEYADFTPREFRALGFFESLKIRDLFRAEKALACTARKIPCENHDFHDTAIRRIFFGEKGHHYIQGYVTTMKNLFWTSFEVLGAEDIGNTNQPGNVVNLKRVRLQEYMASHNLLAPSDLRDIDPIVLSSATFRLKNLHFLQTKDGAVLLRSKGRLRMRYFKMDRAVFDAFFKPGRPENMGPSTSVPSIGIRQPN